MSQNPVGPYYPSQQQGRGSYPPPQQSVSSQPFAGTPPPPPPKAGTGESFTGYTGSPLPHPPAPPPKAGAAEPSSYENTPLPPAPTNSGLQELPASPHTQLPTYPRAPTIDEQWLPEILQDKRYAEATLATYLY
jgi:hypothetical protein